MAVVKAKYLTDAESNLVLATQAATRRAVLQDTQPCQNERQKQNQMPQPTPELLAKTARTVGR